MEIARIAEGMTNKALKSMLDSAKDFDSKVKEEETSVFDSLAKGATLGAGQLKEENSMNEFFDTFKKNTGLISKGPIGGTIHLLKEKGVDLSYKDIFFNMIFGGFIGVTIRLLKELGDTGKNNHLSN